MSPALESSRSTTSGVSRGGDRHRQRRPPCLDLRALDYGPGTVSPLTRRTCWTRRPSLPVSITAP